MQKILVLSFSLIILTGLISCNTGQPGSNENDSLAVFSTDSLSKHIGTLSSNDFLVRKPYSEGEIKTINYLKEEFKAAGLEPGNGDSYIQDVPMVKITTDASPQMVVKSANGKFTLKGFDDYVIWTDKTDSTISLKEDELVFAGYGVVAPEYNWNDYAGLDVKGKVVMVLVNDPGFNAGDTTFFKGNTMTYYGRWTYKFEEASRQGAKGCLIIHNTVAASYPFDVVRNSWSGAQLHLDNRSTHPYPCLVEGWLTGT